MTFYRRVAQFHGTRQSQGTTLLRNWTSSFSGSWAVSVIADSIGGPEHYDLYNPINEPTPLMPEEPQIVIQEIPRNAEVMTLFNKIAGGLMTFRPRNPVISFFVRRTPPLSSLRLAGRHPYN